MKKIIYAVVVFFSVVGLIAAAFLVLEYVQNKKQRQEVASIIKTQSIPKDSKTIILEGKVSFSALVDKSSETDNDKGILFLELGKEVNGTPQVMGRYRFPNSPVFPQNFQIHLDKLPYAFSDAPLIVSAQYWKKRNASLTQHPDYFSKIEFVRNWNQPTARVDLYLLPTYSQPYEQQTCKICEFSGAVHLASGAKAPEGKDLYIAITKSRPAANPEPRVDVTIAAPLRFDSGVANFKKVVECINSDRYRFVMFACPTGEEEKTCLTSKNLLLGNPVMAFSKYTCDLTNKQFFYVDENTDRAKLYTEEIAKFKN
jgi:hypothetical protein